MLASIGLITAVVTLILPPVQDPSAVAGSAGGIAGATNALSGLATRLAALLLGVASLRSQVIPVSIGWILIATGVVTAPILFATPLPATTKWTTDTLAFPRHRRRLRGSRNQRHTVCSRVSRGGLKTRNAPDYPG